MFLLIKSFQYNSTNKVNIKT